MDPFWRLRRCLVNGTASGRISWIGSGLIMTRQPTLVLAGGSGRGQRSSGLSAAATRGASSFDIGTVK